MTSEKIYPLRSFYRPHPRVPELLEITNPVTGEVSKPPSMTKQEFVAECDINNILKQYSITGMLNHVSAKAAIGTYEDLPDPMDFQESLHQVEAARQAFMTLPSKLRDRFGQDPLNFLQFCVDPANADELVELGLAKAPPPSVPLTSIDVETPPEPSKTPPKA